MTFLSYLKDQAALIMTWVLFFILTIVILWLTPDLKLNTSSMAYLALLSGILVSVFLITDYIKKKKWWEHLDIGQQSGLETPTLTAARSCEEHLYQEYLNELSREHYQERNDISEQVQEQKDYIDSWVHEIKVPLSSLTLLTEAIEDDISEKRYTQLLKNIKKMDDYVEQVMYYSRLDHFSKDYLIQSHSLKKMIQKNIKHSADDFIQQAISFHLEGEDYTVLTDDKWLHFILNQLLNNALKYTDPGGSITISLSDNEQGVWLNLTDSGIGIPKEDIRRIFDKGYTGQNGRNEERNSTGLGLYLAKSLTHKLGHQLFVTSTVGEGTTFSLLFPKLNYYNQDKDTFII